ncbi:hypothetical protein TWF132_002258 [Orbilia oligospora]|nr:hypothetical protein TWF132_002258 [Orbilia oligospora]
MDIDPDLVGTLVRTYRFISDVHKISWEDLPHPAFAIIPVVVIALGLKMESTWKFTCGLASCNCGRHKTTIGALRRLYFHRIFLGTISLMDVGDIQSSKL